jgi:hypothetical protein
MITLIITALPFIAFLLASNLVENMTLDCHEQGVEFQFVRLAQGHLESPEARARLPSKF